jgi:hypothetical protein
VIVSLDCNVRTDVIDHVAVHCTTSEKERLSCFRTWIFFLSDGESNGPLSAWHIFPIGRSTGEG